MSLKDESQKQPFWKPAIEIFAKVTGLIAGPIVIALYVGRWLDQRYDSEPWLFLASMAAAFILSSIGIVKITLDYIKKIEKEAEENKFSAPTLAEAVLDKKAENHNNLEDQNNE